MVLRTAGMSGAEVERLTDAINFAWMKRKLSDRLLVNQSFFSFLLLETSMAWWNIFGRTATSDTGEVITRLSNSTSVSSDGTTYTRMGPSTVGSDGSIFNQMGAFSSDGSARMGTGATGLGAVFNQPGNRFGESGSEDRHGRLDINGDDW